MRKNQLQRFKKVHRAFIRISRNSQYINSILDTKLTIKGTFSSYSIDDVGRAKSFYEGVLGLTVSVTKEGLSLTVPNGPAVFLYPKDNHVPATFTVLNFEVPDIEEAVDGLVAAGVRFEQYGAPMKTDEKGIFWGKKENQGPNIAWFKDPASNVLSVVEE